MFLLGFLSTACSLCHFSETGLKSASGNKNKLTKSTSLPGKNGNPTFAAVAAGYDKSPGELSYLDQTSLKVFFSILQMLSSVLDRLCSSGLQSIYSRTFMRAFGVKYLSRVQQQSRLRTEEFRALCAKCYTARFLHYSQERSQHL